MLQISISVSFVCPTFPEMPKTLLVFIHGFLGSARSFLCFGKDIQAFLEKSVGCVDVLHYEYETKGNNTIQVRKLMDYLLLHGNSVNYHSVILCGHSMGGIMAADAYNYLYSTHLLHQESGFAASLASYFSHAPSGDTPSPEDIRFLLRIKGIFSFDSPFYGLHTNVISSGLKKSKELAVLPTDLKPIIEIMPKNVTIPIANGYSVPVSTEWVKDKLKGSDVNASSQNTAAPGDPTSQSSSWYDWSKNAAISLAKIVGAPVTIGGHEQSFVMPLQDYSEFLLPLVSSAEPRINLLMKEHDSKKIVFKAFYNTITLKPVSDKTTLGEQKDPIVENWFCRLPPAHHEHHFSKLQTPVQDPIDAHMQMFDGSVLGTEYYSWLVEHVGAHIRDAILADGAK